MVMADAPGAPTSKPRGRRRWPILEITSFCLTVNAGVVFVLLADLQDAYALSDAEVGLIASGGFVASLVVTLALAPFADRGHVTAVGTIGLVISVLAGLGFTVATAAWSLILSRAALGVGFGLFAVAARKAIVGDAVDGAGARMGRYLSFIVAGFLLGPPLGALLAPIGLWAPFLVPALVVAVLSPLAIAALRAMPVAISTPRYADMVQLTRDPAIQGAALLQMVIFGWIGIFDSTIDRHLTDLGVENLGTAAILLVIGAPLLVLPARAGAWAERVGPRRVMAIGIAIALSGYAGFGLVLAWSAVLIAGFANTVGESLAFPGLQLAVVQRTGAERSAIGQTLIESVGTLAAAATAFLGPVVFTDLGPRTLYGGYAALGFVLAIVAIRRLRVLGPV